jgi:hypothetical protein
MRSLLLVESFDLKDQHNLISAFVTGLPVTVDPWLPCAAFWYKITVFNMYIELVSKIIHLFVEIVNINLHKKVFWGVWCCRVGRVMYAYTVCFGAVGVLCVGAWGRGLSISNIILAACCCYYSCMRGQCLASWPIEICVRHIIHYTHL